MDGWTYKHNLIIKIFNGHNFSVFALENIMLTNNIPEHIKNNPNIKCVNPECISITESKECDITYIKYDMENMKYIYICNHCGQKWKNN